VTLEAYCEGRLPGSVESAAYFMVSEGLANVAKYARATEARVAVRRVDGGVIVEVTDNGIGGANAAQGSGLRGLADRLGAIDGTLSLDSPPGGGTRLRAEIDGIRGVHRAGAGERRDGPRPASRRGTLGCHHPLAGGDLSAARGLMSISACSSPTAAPGKWPRDSAPHRTRAPA
jgi:hypothetical protein